MLLITGGAGFIGSNLVAALERLGLGPLIVADWPSDKNRPNLAKHKVTIIDPDALEDFLKKDGAGLDAVFHMGAISSTTETDPARLNKYNLEYSKMLFRWCSANNKRFIYASSAATYGDGKQGFEDKEDAASLKKLQPLNLYGKSKNDFDIFVAETAEKKPPQIAGLKFFNVYGPNEYHKGGQRSVAHQVYQCASKGEAFPLFKSYNPEYADGAQQRDFVWIGDCVDIMLWLFENPGVNGLFNVASGKARAFVDLASAVYRAMGMEPKITYADMPQQLRGQYQYFTEGPMRKLQAAGYKKPTTTLEDGVKAYVQDYLVKPDPYC
jgi:ADP-L-glycero-D-manno-heptose 6-epimerase